MPFLPFGTLSLIAHTCINIVFFLWKVFTTPRLLIPALIVIATSGTALYFAVQAGYLVLANTQNNAQIVRDSFYTCDPITRSMGERMVVLRLDDVQAHAFQEPTKRMVHTALKYNMPVVAGVIPKDISTDPDMLRFLRRNHCNLEIAMHGYDHQPYLVLELEREWRVAEFEELDVHEANQRIKRGVLELQEVTDDHITSFIPPENKISDDARAAFHTNGIGILSSEGNGYYDYHASFWNYVDHQINTAAHVISECEAHFLISQTCVIMLHPQDILDPVTKKIDESRYVEYVHILEYIRKEGIPVVTFKDLYDAGISD